MGKTQCSMEGLMQRERRQICLGTTIGQHKKHCNVDMYSVVGRKERRTITIIWEVRDGLPVKLVLDSSPGINPSKKEGWKEVIDGEKSIFIAGSEHVFGH